MIIANNTSKHALSAINYSMLQNNELDKLNNVIDMALDDCRISNSMIKAIATANNYADNIALDDIIDKDGVVNMLNKDKFNVLAFSALIDVSYNNLISADISLQNACIELASLKNIFGYGHIVDFNGKRYNGFNSFLSDYYQGYSPKTLALYADIGSDIYLPIKHKDAGFEGIEFLSDYSPSILKPLVNLDKKIKKLVFTELESVYNQNGKLTSRIIAQIVKDAKTGKVGLPKDVTAETAEKDAQTPIAEQAEKGAQTPIAEQADVYDASAKAVKQRVDKMLFAGYDTAVDMCSMTIDLGNKEAFISLLDNCSKNGELAKAFINAFKLKVVEGFKV